MFIQTQDTRGYSRVQRQLTAWQAENPGIELWVTEYGNLQGADADTMRQMTAWLSEHVDRYAYFYFGDPSGGWDYTSLYMEPWPLPQLTELGEVYRLLGEAVHLELWVKVKTNWADNEKDLMSLGYEGN